VIFGGIATIVLILASAYHKMKQKELEKKYTAELDKKLNSFICVDPKNDIDEYC
tara:strand:+ start:328 stop:489 length:162 start_codon:yes stop_codon:yes gene_type:complete